jgi:hypothetical protein
LIALEPNPWRDLPSTPPYVLPRDQVVLDRHPDVKAGLQLDLLPAPHQGDPDSAQVWLLMTNPGGRTNDFEVGPEFVRERRRSLTFESDFPVFSLDSRWTTHAAYRYWTRRLRHLIKAVGIDTVAHQLMIVQYFPYQSREYRPLPEPLPSQRFTFGIVRRACEQGQLMVVLCGERYWLRAVPQLSKHGYVMARSPLSGHVSPGNLGEEEFRRVLERIVGRRAPR